MTSVLFNFASDGEANAFTDWLRAPDGMAALLATVPSGVSWRIVSGATLNGPLDGGVGPTVRAFTTSVTGPYEHGPDGWRLNDAAHRFLHGDPATCITPAQAEEISAVGGYPGLVCVWEAIGGDAGARLRQALEAAGVRVGTAERDTSSGAPT